MPHTQRFWSNRYIGTLQVTLVGGKKMDVTIHKEGNTVWLNRDNIVHPMNTGSLEGIIREIGVLNNTSVKDWEWKTTARPLKFRGR